MVKATASYLQERIEIRWTLREFGFLRYSTVRWFRREGILGISLQEKKSKTVLSLVMLSLFHCDVLG